MRGTQELGLGRAKILFRKAMRRYNLRQEVLHRRRRLHRRRSPRSGVEDVRLSLQNNLIGSLSAAHLGGYLRGVEVPAGGPLALGGDARRRGRRRLSAAPSSTRARSDARPSGLPVGHRRCPTPVRATPSTRHEQAYGCCEIRRRTRARHTSQTLRVDLERLGLESNGTVEWKRSASRSSLALPAD